MNASELEVMSRWQEDHAAWRPLAIRLDGAARRAGMHIDPLLHEALHLGAGALPTHLRDEHRYLLARLDALDPVLAEDARVDHAVLHNAAHAVVHFVGTGQDPRRAVRALAAALQAHVRLHEAIAERLRHLA